MNTRNQAFVGEVDVHDALARAHADRAAYISRAFAGVPALVKRLVAAIRPHRSRKGAWA